jgi:uncharacterized protein with PIN domain
MGNSASRKKAASMRQVQIRAKAPNLQIDESRPRFVADVMLGRLAKWLRIAGFDVLYSNQFTDDELVALSRREGRILLSRDTRLLIRKSVKEFIFLESEKIQDQIQQIFLATHTADLASLLTRCLSCNEPLIDVPRESVRDSVPPFVYETQVQFKSCPRCQKIFWAGTHRQSVLRTLMNLLPKRENGDRRQFENRGRPRIQ